MKLRRRRAARPALTPNFDKLASEGVRLLNCNVEAQGVPSYSAFLTGRHAIRSGTTKVVWGMIYDLVQWVEARVGWVF
jgi:arylsulfatase A-like enzyme